MQQLNMYQPEQARPESTQGMHFHVHQCVCTSPLFNPYRQPSFMTPYVPAAVPRPYNLAHYQYMSYNIPYSIPMFSPVMPPPMAPNMPAPAVALPMPEHVMMRRYEHDPAVELQALRAPEDPEDYGLLLPDPNTENFTKFLEAGCIIAEKIAIRNQHRPCFKNIQNLCNRTKNEIMKPCHTVSNIHSQGIPWATKDFIYAYVRLINCWHMLKGYLQVREGTLGNIDRELTAEFKSCYTLWESNTKDLAEHMIRIFSNLDNNVSNPVPVPNMMNRGRIVRMMPSNLVMDISSNMNMGVQMVQPAPPQPPPPSEGAVYAEAAAAPNPVPPRAEEPEGGRIYMKPGSYNVPRKANSTPSPPAIEFFETAKNISIHYKKLEAKRAGENMEREWKNAISATNSLIKKNIYEEPDIFSDNHHALLEDQASCFPHMPHDLDNVHHWLYHEHYEQHNMFPLADMNMLVQDKAVQPPQMNQGMEASGMSAHHPHFAQPHPMYIHPFQSSQMPPVHYRKYVNRPEKDFDAMKVLLEELEKTELNKTLSSETGRFRECRENLQTLIHKYNCQIYKGPDALIYDLKRLTTSCQNVFSNEPEIMRQIKDFSTVMDETLQRTFMEVNMEEMGSEEIEISSGTGVQ